MAAKTIEEKLDGLGEHLNKIHTGQDEIRESHKQLSARIDALEKRDAALPHETDEEAREIADRMRRDGKSEREDKARPHVDAEEKDRLERADREAAVRSQMKADRAFQAWSMGQAPPRLAGEDLRDYRVRLLIPHRQHSKMYAGSDLHGIADESAFSTVEDSIINDSVHASTSTVVEGAPLRMVTEKNESGHIVRKFYGDPAVTWGPFMGGAIRIAKLQRPQSK